MIGILIVVLLALGSIMVIGALVILAIKHPVQASIIAICLFIFYKLQIVPCYLDAPPQALGYTITASFQHCHPDSLIRLPRFDRQPFLSYVDSNSLSEYSDTVTILEFNPQWFGTHLWRVSNWKRDVPKHPNELTYEPVYGDYGRLVEHMSYSRFVPKVQNGPFIMGDNDPRQRFELRPGEPGYR